MTNGDKIRNMTDKQLYRFLWTWKINSVTNFILYGGTNSMDAKEMSEWITSDKWECSETNVAEEFVYDADFNDKERS